MSSECADAVVRFDHVSKRFPLGGRRSLVREASPFAASLGGGTDAIDDLTFSIGPGTALGVIGRNGAGKSTALKLAAGIMEPTQGTVSVAGVPGAMIELGLAFHPDLTGWENLPSAAALLGLDASQLDDVIDDVVEFSGIGDLLHLQVKHFSTGMVARLGFALATHLPAQVLLVDEVLAVGDRRFQNSCIQRVRSLVRTGVSLLFVSHDLDLVCHVCDRAICLDGGRIVDEGPAVDVVGRYARNMLAPRGENWRRSARIEMVEVVQPSIPTGGNFDVRCVVDVVEPTMGLTLSSQIYPPSSGVGTVNLDRFPPGSFGAPGRWEASAVIGPIPSSAATLELEVALVEPAAPGAARGALVDRATLPVQVVGEELGSPMWVMDGGWRVLATDPSVRELGRPVSPVPDHPVVRAEGLSKRFSTRRPAISDLLSGQRQAAGDDLAALAGIEVAVRSGEAVGLVGPNGAGKSTLLRVLAGVSEPTSGAAMVAGRLVAVLELGIGFQPEMTGDENLRFSWVLEGGEKDRFDEARHAIMEFADLGDVIGVPLKHYSSGMRARLALSLALELRPDVMFIDEALSTGDIEFRHRVVQRLSAMCADGMTLLFASHDLHMVQRLCDRVLRLDAGRLVEDGPAAIVISNAGGAGWAGGTATADGGLVVRDLRVIPDVIAWGEPLDVQFELEVRRPMPSVYLEFSMRQTLDDVERAEPKSPADVLQLSLCVQRIDAASDAVGTTGIHHVVGRIEDIPATNSTDIVISAIDSVDGKVVSEQWHTVFLGRATDEDLAGRVVVEWTANPVTPG